MGCSCNKNKEQGPGIIDFKPSSWGPVYWRVLHTLVERTGFKTNIYRDSDEKYPWSFILKELSNVLPCAECKQNYISYYNINNPSHIINLNFEERRNALRIWMYNLHLHTPRVSDCPTPTLEELPSIYSLSQINIIEDMKNMFDIMNKASNQGIISGINVYNFKTKMELLRILSC
jgi:hypothetical protein